MANTRIRFDNGQVVTLTSGEIKAIERLAQMNGTDPLKIQYDPGHVQRRTLNNLRNKGILRQDPSRSCFHFAEGLLPVQGMSLYAPNPFTLKGREV